MKNGEHEGLPWENPKALFKPFSLHVISLDKSLTQTAR